MNLLNQVFNLDKDEINRVNKKYIIVFSIMMALLIVVLFLKKDYYYENSLLFNEDSIMLLVNKDEINKINDNRYILINGIKSDYSINRIIEEGNICYADINLKTNITNISQTKYKILLGKETIFEYIIRIIRKVS